MLMIAKKSFLGSFCMVAMMTLVATCPVRADEERAVSKIAFDEVEPLEFSWGWIRWLMSADADPKAEMTLGIVQIKPNQSNPLHMHPNCEECLHVLSGTLEHRLGNKWITLKTGDTLRIPRGVVHTARTGDDACRVMVVYDTGRRAMVHVTEAKKTE